MKKFIVTTTINTVTEAITKFDNMSDWELIVIGDLKTPKDFKIRGQYWTPEMQEKKHPKLSAILGWNSVDRRNIGFLEAWLQGADVVAMVDDDNIPLDNWGKNLMVGKPTSINLYDTEDIVFDPLSATNNHKFWHRGFPIELLHKKNYNTHDYAEHTIVPLVQADLWNFDPDVDAMCRLVYGNIVVYFNSLQRPFGTTAKFTPFNMQNTFVHRDALPYLISIPFTGRMCDIWGAYYLESLFPNRVVYNDASVNHIQNRSQESLCRDLIEEFDGYKTTMKLLEGLNNSPDFIFKFLPKEAINFIIEYQKYFKI